MKTKVLIVEDDININTMLIELLTQKDYLTATAYSGTEAVLYLEKQKADIILLDLMLPGMRGEEVIKKIRQYRQTPIIVISAIDAIPNKVEVLKLGADDYLTKPFNNEELLARMETVLRRNTNQERDTMIGFKDLILDKNTREVKVKNTPIIFTKNEYEILEMLVSNPNKVFTKNAIFEQVWQENYIGEDNTLNVHISNIRKKIATADPEQEYIQTVWGIGFKMNNTINKKV